MIYRLNYIENHPAYRIHEAVSWFVMQLEHTEDFGIKMFHDDFPDFVPILENHETLVQHLQNVLSAYQTIESGAEKAQVIESFNYWNNINHVCHNCDVDFVLWDDLSKHIRESIKDLYDYLYTQLTKKSGELEIRGMLRRHHYKDFWKSNGKVCCYCGIRELDDPDVQLNAYDHYLHISKYPFCGVNYLNIVPICDKCNESPAKGAGHVVFSNYENRERREAFYPYEAINQPLIRIDMHHIFPSDVNNITITIQGDSAPRIQTWKEIFNIDARYQSAVRTEMKGWIGNFVKLRKESVDSIDELKQEMQEHIIGLTDSSRYLYQHLEIAFWNSISDNETEVDLLLQYVNEQRRIKYQN